MKLVKIAFLVIILAIIIGGVIAYNYYQNTLTKTNSDNSETIQIEIKSGSGASTIGELLYSNKLILDLNVWKIYTKLNNPSLLADTYNIPQNLTMLEVIETLGKGQEDKTTWITIPEGKTTKQIIEIFKSKKDGFDNNFDISGFEAILRTPDNYLDEEGFSTTVRDFITKYKPSGKPLEGFFYPETYALPINFNAKQVVNMVLEQFIKMTNTLDLPQDEGKFYEILILSSIVERESLNNTDRPYVASVFTNRLKINMALQSDATVVYITGKNDPRPTYDDLKIDSPYNTYKYPGLPPTPISNPRIQSIENTLNPIKSDYYYFIHEPDGTAHFGKTLADHNHNVCKYLDKSCN